MKKSKAPDRPRFGSVPGDREQMADRLAAEYPGVPQRVIDAAVAESAHMVGLYGRGLDETMLVEAIARHHLDGAVGQESGEDAASA